MKLSFCLTKLCWLFCGGRGKMAKLRKENKLASICFLLTSYIVIYLASSVSLWSQISRSLAPRLVVVCPTRIPDRFIHPGPMVRFCKISGLILQRDCCWRALFPAEIGEIGENPWNLLAHLCTSSTQGKYVFSKKYPSWSCGTNQSLSPTKRFAWYLE